MNKYEDETNHEISVKTYRFKISNPNLYEEMVMFADKNRFLNKNDLKEKFKKWIEEPKISSMVRSEEEMLKLNHYDLGKNNISQKIFKSIKYYHIKKIISKNPQHSLKQKDNRKKETVFSKELLEKVKQVLQNSKDLKPSQYYEKFVNENVEIIEREKVLLGFVSDGDERDTETLFDSRLKKMMKNQYYMMFQKDK